MTVAPTGSHTYKKGDVLIELPEPLNEVVESTISGHKCTDFRRNIIACVFDGVQNLMRQVGAQDGALSHLYDKVGDLPLPNAGDLQDLINEIISWAMTVATLAIHGLESNTGLATLAFWLVYLRLVLKQGSDSSDTTHVIPSKSRCHIPEAIPFCHNCGGAQSGKHICKGVRFPRPACAPDL